MERRRHRASGQTVQPVKIDWDCMLKDILSHWWMILLAAVTAALLTAAVEQFLYTPAYTAETTFVIGKAGFSSNVVSENLSQAETTTKQYTQVVGSSILQNQVCEELGLETFDAVVNVTTVPSSNLMVLQVSADSPRNAYLISRSIISNAVELMGLFMDNVIMQELQSAVIPETPSNPLNLAGDMQKAAAVGILVMVLILALMSYYKDTVKNPEDVSAKIDAKLLGTVYYEKKRKTGGRKGSLLLNNPLLSFGYVEAYRMLAMRVRMAMDKDELKVLMVSSVSENEGKSTVASNIAMAMSEEGKRVLLVDCDFRKPAQYKIFEIENLEDRDFSVAVSKRDRVKIGHVRNYPGLYTLFSHKPIGRAWNTEEFRYIADVIDQLKRRVDYIIIDTAPMALVSDTEEYAAIADASLLVIRQDVMEACYINDAVDVLVGADTKLLGCVLNGVRRGMVTRTMEYGHYSGSNYGRYSHYNKTREQGES